MATYESIRYSFGGSLVTALQSPNMADGTVTNTEFQFINTLTANAQTQINAKFGAAGGTFSGDVTLADNVDLNFGNGNDMIITSNGTASFIKGNAITIEDTSGNDMANFVANGASKLFFGGTQKLETTNTGTTIAGTLAAGALQGDGTNITALAAANITSGGTLPGLSVGGNLDFADGIRERFGSSQEFQIYHNGTDTFLENSSGQLVLQADNLRLKNGANNATLATFTQGGSADLFFNGSTKVSTTNTGINVNGTITGNGSGLTSLNGSNISSGTVADARISTLTASKLTGALPAIDGSALTGIETVPSSTSAVGSIMPFMLKRTGNSSNGNVTLSTGTEVTPSTYSSGIFIIADYANETSRTVQSGNSYQMGFTKGFMGIGQQISGSSTGKTGVWRVIDTLFAGAATGGQGQGSYTYYYSVMGLMQRIS
jgi:hypothetical protein|tara:strand:- start:710 stop:2002 length:1293 start_codon:yes stop_codon:yes gene_type:complete